MRIATVDIPGREETKRRFDKEKSVFKHWIKDTPESLGEAARFDFARWKVPNFCKDPADL